MSEVIYGGEDLDRQTPVDIKEPTFWEILRVSLDPVSAAGILSGAFSVMNLIMREAKITPRGIFEVMMIWYREHIQDAIINFVKYVNLNWHLPFQIPEFDRYTIDATTITLIMIFTFVRMQKSKYIDDSLISLKISIMRKEASQQDHMISLYSTFPPFLRPKNFLPRIAIVMSIAIAMGLVRLPVSEAVNYALVSLIILLVFLNTRNRKILLAQILTMCVAVAGGLFTNAYF